MMFIVASCSTEAELSISVQKPPKEYLKWREEIASLFDDHLFRLPPFNPETGPLKMVYELSDSKLSFDLYRWEQYEIQTELTGPHTPHDHYFSFSVEVGGKPFDDVQILAVHNFSDAPVKKRVNDHAYILNDSFFVYHDNGIAIYQDVITREQNEEILESLVSLMKKYEVRSGQIEIVNLERRTRIDLYAFIDQYFVETVFYVYDREQLEPFFKGVFSGEK